MNEDWDDINAELNSPAGANSYYKPASIAVGSSEEVVVVSHMKWLDTKYPIKDKDGNSKGYTWRFRLSTGQVWDVSNANRKVLIAGLHPNGSKEVIPARFKITNIGKVVNKQPSTKVEFLRQEGSAGTVEV